MTDHWPIDALQDAWQLATGQHAGQTYGGFEQGEQIVYLNHIGSVTFEIISASFVEKGMNLDLALKCAVLHDTLEDTELSYETLLHKYGKAVAEGVLALTKSQHIVGKREQMADSLQRIKQQPKEVWAVKMADRIANLYAPPYYWNDEKKTAYMEEAWLIHRELCEGSSYLADRLAEKIRAYRRFIQNT